MEKIFILKKFLWFILIDIFFSCSRAMPHVFQLFLFHPSSISSIKRTGAFIRKAIPEMATTINNSNKCYNNNNNNNTIGIHWKSIITKKKKNFLKKG